MRRSHVYFLLKITCLQAPAAVLAGCASAPLTTSGSLASYDGLAPAAGVVTKSRLKVDKADILAARSIAIVPTSYSSGASRAELTDQQRHVIANAVDRSVCIGLSDGFDVVPSGQAADLAVHVTITDVTVTNATVAGVSKVASIAPAFLSGGASHIIVPRIPLGMGSLSVEAEARDMRGRQKAAFVWARGADMLTSTARVSASGDAYDLASEFGADFSKLMNTGENPFDNKLSIPSSQRVQSAFGGKSKYAACDAFGRTGVPAFLGGKALGVAPEWVDDAKPVTE
jgi:uncharacterized protein DUF3313